MVVESVLDARVVVDRGEFAVDVSLSLSAGETVAIVGPNGAGKTTVLSALAGLLPVEAGRIAVGGTVVDDPDTGVWLAAQRRNVGMVFQDYLLFPHLSALDNVAFGLRRRGWRRAAARREAADWLKRVGLDASAMSRKPRRLSGGQAQRVAVARSMAPEPGVLLLDEPLAALDARTRLDMRAELHQRLNEHQGGAVVVTHDPVDALVLADRMVVVESGRVVQEGTAAEITSQPRTDYVARLVGLNLYRGLARGTSVVLDNGMTVETGESLRGAAFVAFSPQAVALHAVEPEGSPRNSWPVEVESLYRHGDHVRVALAGSVRLAADVTPSAAAELALSPGRRLWAAVKATEVRAYPD
ncbi:ABC transporter ATP-binding protein [Haloglycomyces albus]|uniref:ABC transporter ATP-binding protein n=1 Tax=Haloglycomyces albus TaxID=526067 RepID=UPI00046CA81D|nr:ABC transporter ATP-binding protein [Haloglycomyces albus]